MQYNTSLLCDIYADTIDVVEPLLTNFGGRSSFAGEVVTIKCFESVGLIYKTLALPFLDKNNACNPLWILWDTLFVAQVQGRKLAS